MKNIFQLWILLLIICSATSQTRPISDDQIRTAYNKVAQRDQCFQKLDSAKAVAFSLDNLIQFQNDSLQKQLTVIQWQNDTIKKYQAVKLDKSVMKAKKWGFWDWVLYGVSVGGSFYTGYKVARNLH